MSNPMTETQFSDFTNLDVALRAVFQQELEATLTDELVSLFGEDMSSDAQEVEQELVGIGNVPKYTGAIHYDAPEPGFKMTYTPDEYSHAIAIARSLIDDGKYGIIDNIVRDFAESYDRTIRNHAASVFANAFSSSYVGGDSVALCSASHPISPTNAGTQSNTGTSALTESTLKATRTAMRKFTAGNGNRLLVVPDTLIVPVDLEDTAREIVEAPLRSGTANNDANVTANTRIIVSPFLSDTNNWFLVDSSRAKRRLRWYWRVRPEFSLDPTSDFNLQRRYRGYMRYSFGWSSWAWVYGHSVT